MLNHSSLVPIHPPLQGHPNFIHSPKNRPRARSPGTQGNRATEGKSDRPTEGNEGASEIESEGTSEREREIERERAKERARERESAKERASAGPENHGQKETPGMCPSVSSSSHPRPLLLCQVGDEEERRAELLSHFTVNAALCLLC
jgi:hypothetical protein